VSSVSDVVVNIATVATGGTVVQGVVLLLRRRSELRQLDAQSDQVAVETAGQLVVMLRGELAEKKTELQDLRTDRDTWRSQVADLAGQVATLRAQVAVKEAEIARLAGGTRPGD
jgi:capsule polysaccharide export protein KpsE/RkpR